MHYKVFIFLEKSAQAFFVTCFSHIKIYHDLIYLYLNVPWHIVVMVNIY